MSASPPIEIRPAVASDIAAVRGFGARHVVAFYTPLLGAEAAQAQVDRWWSDEALRPAVLGGEIVVAVRGGEIAAVAQFDLAMTPPMIWKLYVDPAVRGRGIGARMLDAVCALLPADAPRVGVEHFTVNERAGRFYQREGFAVDRVEEAASGDPRESVTWRVKTLRAGPNPAELRDHDPRWKADAARRLDEIRSALVGLEGADRARFEHIGSTAVPGLAAKPVVDLQVCLLPLPSEAALAERLTPLGYVRATGSRPDSPGVHRDLPRGDEAVADAVWEKRLFVSGDGSTILHIRRQDSPWGRYTVWFRDWLRADGDARDRYARTKRTLSAQNVGKADYDDYTRAKTAFFDEVQEAFVEWARSREGRSAGADDPR